MAGGDRAVIIGGGPAGLFAASLLTGRGIHVDLYEKKSNPGRKFLLAGQSGLNLTNDESPEIMADRYGRNRDIFLSLLEDFSSAELRRWYEDLGVETFRGSGGKIFPRERKPREILELWLNRLESSGLFTLRTGWNWAGWREGGLFMAGEGTECLIRSKPVLFALGGASWPSTGSDGSWSAFFAEKKISLHPFKPVNCGLLVEWSPRLREKYADRPVKNIALQWEGERKRGDFLITEKGLEGGPVYWFSLPLRERLEKGGFAVLKVDLAPDLSRERVEEILGKRPRKKSLSSYLKTRGILSPVKTALLREFTTPEDRADGAALAERIKALPLRICGTEGIKRAISTSGGLDMGSLDENLMIRDLPGYFAAGEMIDWEAPTGGYMIQGCMATAFRAVKGIGMHLK